MSTSVSIEKRPRIETIESGAELRRWYWRKDELADYARNVNVKTTSGKFVILERIAHFLDSGETTYPGDKKRKVKSRFDWHSETLTLETMITDSYKNTQNVRRFFTAEIGAGFKFNIAFMEWMNSSVGKTLSDACAAYREISDQEKSSGFQTNIKDHNQFNQYTRDFLQANPELGMPDVHRIWALKIRLPSDSGRHTYAHSDLNLAP